MERKVPSFKGLSPASAASSHAKRKNPSSDTQPELLLRRHLWRSGLRYRKHVKALPGRPDIVFTGMRIAVFCDGDFWHGRNWESLSVKLVEGTNGAYWRSKIESNINRDRRNTDLLEQAGWQVIRVWESDIKQDIQQVSAKIVAAIQARQICQH